MGVVQEGVRPEIVGTGFGGGKIVKVMVLETPLFPEPECGLRVLTAALPCLAVSVAGTTAVIPVTFPELFVVTVVLRLLPFH